MSLDEILRKYFRCGKTFLKTPRFSGRYYDNPASKYMTEAGCDAYDKLIWLLYDLEELLGKEFNARRWIRELDITMRAKD
jgi:hypothetical protein